jgi:hypothetical protein
LSINTRFICISESKLCNSLKSLTLSSNLHPVGGIRNHGDQNSSKLSLQVLASKTHFCMEKIFHFLFEFFSTYPHVNFFLVYRMSCWMYNVLCRFTMCPNCFEKREKDAMVIDSINNLQHTK